LHSKSERGRKAGEAAEFARYLATWKSSLLSMEKRKLGIQLESHRTGSPSFCRLSWVAG
jgi:hypothetical protein